MNSDQPLFFQLFDILEEKFIPFVTAFGGETLEIPSIIDIRNSVKFSDIVSTMVKFRAITNNRTKKTGMDQEREKAIQRLMETYDIPRKEITDIFLKYVREFNLSVMCYCGNPTIPGKLVCNLCSNKRSDNMKKTRKEQKEKFE